eukprot:Gregarina_sp_Poly_1__1377@NODE_1340_length_4345_cov_84_710145_g900_i0_p4_GENE_NODE_1340_length_4345_cov_84_710145_g900_i0NODE_1340_length_4345_cov_84_710145_g900_i0_p4_ORF_typecomplete_len147_score11_96Herpes_gE/PF02480_16/8_3e07SIT/PF15330_6/3_2e03SIT/PF15330_6/0_00013TMEM154/PF15102_6/0_00037Alpha_GJ/PF03229_13/0_00043GAPT/PF11770_8/0_0018LapA_dom/PF06305_11/0_00347tm_1/PF00001_21/0_0033DUF5305/PF17231_2/0_0039EphA2_TM/PF14575_6/0_0077PepSY_TM/PF03929_16/0_0049Mid2/PF04478_12/0_015TMEM132D_C/P
MNPPFPHQPYPPYPRQQAMLPLNPDMGRAASYSPPYQPIPSQENYQQHRGGESNEVQPPSQGARVAVQLFISIGLFGLIILVIVCLWLWYRRSRRLKRRNKSNKKKRKKRVTSKQKKRRIYGSLDSDAAREPSQESLYGVAAYYYP